MIERRDGSVTGLAIGAACLLAAIGLGLFALASGPAPSGPSQWKGYRVLLVDAGIPEATVLSALRDQGLGNVLSESTDLVSVSAWDKTETMPLAAARASLAPGDPRLDAYLQRLGQWFDAKAEGIAYRVYYLEVGPFFMEGTRLEARISAALEGHSARFVLADSTKSASQNGGLSLYFAASIAFLLAAAAGPLFSAAARGVRSRRFQWPGSSTLSRLAFRLALIVPWAILASRGGINASLSVLWGLAFIEFADKLDLPLEELKSGKGLKEALGSLLRQPRFPLSLAATAFIALAIFSGSLIPVLLACLGSIAAGLGYACATAMAGPRKRFVPLPIFRLSRRQQGSAAERARGLIACATVILACISSILPAATNSGLPSGTASYPRPVAVRGDARPMPVEARSRGASETGETLPGIASYLEHRALQEALPFIPIGEAKTDPFAPVNLPIPSGVGHVLAFDDEWARKAYSSIASPSIEAMLLAQGGATVGRAGSLGIAPGAQPLAPIDWLLYILLLVPPLTGLARTIPQARVAPTGELRQEA